MPRSSTTFPPGNGSQGPAKGAGKPPGNKLAGRPKGVKTGEGKKATFRALMAPHIPSTAQRWQDILNNPKHPHHARMIEKHVELEQEFKQTVELTGKDGGSIPLSIGVTFVEPKHDEP